MKKPSRTTGRSKAALTAAALALPLIGALPEAMAQKPTTAPSKVPVISPARSNFTIKLASTVQLVGIDSGRIVYRNKAGEHFYLDAATGDMKFITKTGPAIKLVGAGQKFVSSKDLAAHKDLVAHKDLIAHKDGATTAHKVTNKTFLDLTIVGTDAKGNVLHRTTSGELFFLDGATGDMVFVD